MSSSIVMFVVVVAGILVAALVALLARGRDRGLSQPQAHVPVAAQPRRGVERSASQDQQAEPAGHSTRRRAA